MIRKLFFCALSLTTSLYSARLLLSDLSKTEQSFNFSVGPHDLYIPDGRVFVAASQPMNDNNFAVAAVRRGELLFTPLTPVTVTLNNEKDQVNPLHGASIKHLALLGARAVVAKSDVPASVYLIDEARNAVFEASDIHDAQGESAHSILALETSAPSVITPIDLNGQLAAFAAVSNKQGGFDGDGSGIALLFFKRFSTKQKLAQQKLPSEMQNENLAESVRKIDYFVWDIVNAQTGVSQFTRKGKPQPGGNQAASVGKTSPALFIGSPLSSLGSVIDLHYDREMGRLYIALQVEAGAGANDGARALLMGGVENGRLLFGAIAPDAAFDDNNKIVGGRGAHAITQLFKVRTMQTRTFVRYLIVVGGNGDSDSNKRSVYALPIVDNVMSGSHGTLANVTSDPVTVFSEIPPHRFQTRVFARPATKPDELFTVDSPQARVGGDGELPSAITDIVVAAEAVFVSVKDPGAVLQPGIFYSQPLFDARGRISSWTRWQRVAGTAQSIAGFLYDPLKGTHSYIPFINNNGTVETNSILRTEWTEGKDPLAQFISRYLFESNGGVQSVNEYPYTTPSFSTMAGLRIGVQVYTGFETVLLVQSGADDRSGNFGPVQFSEITGAHRTFNKGALSHIGPVTSTAVVTDGTFGWFVVGGSGGVAILADNQGRGWSAQQGLQTGFKGLPQEIFWQIIAPTTNVRKLIGIGNKLFVLTDEAVERFEINWVNRNLTLTKTVIAQLTSAQKGQFKSYSDLIVSGPLALLATSFGLLRSGNGVDSMTIAGDAQWVPVVLPESAGSLTGNGPVTRFFAISPTGVETDVAFGGTVYLLNAYVSLSQALIYRLTLNVDAGVTDNSVELYPDYFVKDKKTFFHNLGTYRNYFVTDGALLIASRSAFERANPLLELLPFFLKSGQVRRSAERVPFLTLTGRTFAIGETRQSAASGAWIASGDFGIRVLE